MPSSFRVCCLVAGTIENGPVNSSMLMFRFYGDGRLNVNICSLTRTLQAYALSGVRQAGWGKSIVIMKVPQLDIIIWFPAKYLKLKGVNNELQYM